MAKLNELPESVQFIIIGQLLGIAMSTQPEEGRYTLFFKTFLRELCDSKPEIFANWISDLMNNAPDPSVLQMALSLIKEHNRHEGVGRIQALVFPNLRNIQYN